MYLPTGFRAVHRMQLDIIRKKPFYEQVFAHAIGLSIDIYFDAAESYAARRTLPRR